jgi:non-specific serine/threonine protein kinase
MVAAPRSHLHNLPLSASSFIGREREIAEAKRLLLSTRLLTLTGPGGCGKTRLAIAVADDLLETAGVIQGAWFIDLSGLSTASLVPQIVVITLRIPETPDRPPEEILIDFFQDKPALLILDNCEHVLSACVELTQTLLSACPQLRILTTSREPLNLVTETVWLVPSLTLPEQSFPSTVRQAAESEAIQLFVARASAVLPEFKLSEDNVTLVEQICRRLDGIPLAIELAAARVRVLDVGQIADRLDASLQLLARGGHTATPRHQTMRAALDWSYQLLLPREQALFQRLAVFAGSCTLVTIEAVCADELLSAAEILDLLAGLVEKSLVSIAEREPGEGVRYRLLEPIAQYALEKLGQTGAEAAVRDRHLAYYIELAEQAEPQLKSEHQLLWLKRLEKEHDDLRAALAWCAHEASRDIAGLRLAAALHLFWQRRDHWTEGRHWLAHVIARYEAHPDLQSPIGDRHLARTIVAQGWLAVYLQEYTNIRESLERGLSLAQIAGDWATAAHALGLLAFLTRYRGDRHRACQLAEAGVESARRSGERWSLAWTLHVLGRMWDEGDNAPAGRAALKESEALFREIGDRRMLAVHINTVAIVAENAGESAAARRWFEEVLAIGEELEDQELRLKALSNLAGLALVEEDMKRAEQFYEQALALAQTLGTTLTVNHYFVGLARIRLRENDIAAAETLLRQNLTLKQTREYPLRLAMALAGMSRIEVERGQVQQAARIWGAVSPYLAQQLDADDRVDLDRWEAAVRAALSPAEFETAFAAGRALTLEQALEEISPPTPTRMVSAVAQPSPADTLHLQALGPVRVFRGERVLTSWPYARIKELLFYLVAHTSRTKAQIGLALWPEAAPAQLRNSLSTALYQLRRVLGNPDWIIFENDVYRFNRARAYQFDVEVFEFKLAQANRALAHTPDHASTLLQEAIAHYQGDFVEDFLAGEWFLLRREELRRKYLDALLSVGQLHFAQNQYAPAAEFYRRALEKDDMLEEAHRELIRCYARLGERGQALRHYQTFEQMMRAELGAAPAAATAALIEQLKRGEEI